MASEVIHTDDLTPRQLRNYIWQHFGSDADRAGTFLQVMSFGFKYGVPVDADLIIDVRFFKESTTLRLCVNKRAWIKQFGIMFSQAKMPKNLVSAKVV